MTSRGQVTFNKKIQRHFGLKPGDKFDLELLPNGRGMLKAAERRGTIDDLTDLFSGASHPYVSDEDIKKAIERAWAGEL
jgi:bifunctional DNA-binding transcriptional regulator/antitoxin component of YhaV-PrlF toxin-antitoxin module